MDKQSRERTLISFVYFERQSCFLIFPPDLKGLGVSREIEKLFLYSSNLNLLISIYYPAIENCISARVLPFDITLISLN